MNLNSEVTTVDRTRIQGMTGTMPAKAASIDGTLDVMFDIIDLMLWIVDLFGAVMDLIRDFGEFVVGE